MGNVLNTSSDTLFATCINLCVCENHKYKLQYSCLFSAIRLLESTVNRMQLLVYMDSSSFVQLSITAFYFALLFNAGTYCLGNMQLCGVIFPKLSSHLFNVSESCSGKHRWENSGT